MNYIPRQASGAIQPPSLASWPFCLLFIFLFFYIESTDYSQETRNSLLNDAGSKETFKAFFDQVQIDAYEKEYLGYGHILAPVVTSIFLIETRRHKSFLKQVAVLFVILEVLFWSKGYFVMANFLFISLAVFITIVTRELSRSERKAESDDKVVFSSPHEAEIRRLIKAKDPHRLGQVDGMLMQFAGREDDLLQEIRDKYQNGGSSNSPSSSSGNSNNRNSSSVSGSGSGNSNSANISKRKASPGRSNASTPLTPISGADTSRPPHSPWHNQSPNYQPSPVVSSHSGSSSSIPRGIAPNSDTTKAFMSLLDDPHPHSKHNSPASASKTSPSRNISSADRVSRDSLFLNSSSSVATPSHNNSNSNNNSNSKSNSYSNGSSETRKVYSNKINFKDFIMSKSPKLTTVTNLSALSQANTPLKSPSADANVIIGDVAKNSSFASNKVRGNDVGGSPFLNNFSSLSTQQSSSSEGSEGTNHTAPGSGLGGFAVDESSMNIEGVHCPNSVNYNNNNYNNNYNDSNSSYVDFEGHKTRSGSDLVPPFASSGIHDGN